ncbi:hypothetical protein L1987_57608 [Smallanthus sonchifolius]|uniref:Uncharacterized protein n=1 Tax=Smallanthus sonchifolius TaxID=185202 RepID=A0ACB9DDB0_9ASTR|nr:hypothetical protein L1987_57608 [Smallanthus sonchifolius]
MGHSSCAASRKRLRVFISPISIDSPNSQSLDVDRGYRNVFPSFPDLNNPAHIDPGSSDESLSLQMGHSDGISGSDTSTVVPETQQVGNMVDIDEEVADTIEVGTCVGIQVEDFADQVRLLIQGEGVVNGFQ